MPILRGKQFAITKDLSNQEQSLGVDLRINKDGDLVLNNLDDFELIAGSANAAQVIFLNLNIEPGGLVYHPFKGVNLQIGEKTRDAFLIKSQIVSSLAQDPRFEAVDIRVEVINNVVVVTGHVLLANSGVEVPFQFVATEGDSVLTGS